MPRLVRIDVVKKGAGWVAQQGQNAVVQASTKVEAVRKAAQYAIKSGVPTSLRIHKVNGQIQEERTYSRSDDPRRSKG
jgi:Uncharacterized protein conserved in bacteria (DUF2188)